MQHSSLRKLVWVVALAGLGSITSACNTTKATVDTTVNFFSSTTPQDILTGDGLVAEDQKVNLFVGVGFDNLQQDIARGQGEYLASLENLLKIPTNQHTAFAELVQTKYPVLFTSDFTSDRTAHMTAVANLKRELSADSKLGK